MSCQAVNGSARPCSRACDRGRVSAAGRADCEPRSVASGDVARPRPKSLRQAAGVSAGCHSRSESGGAIRRQDPVDERGPGSPAREPEEVLTPQLLNEVFDVEVLLTRIRSRARRVSRRS